MCYIIMLLALLVPAQVFADSFSVICGKDNYEINERIPFIAKNLQKKVKFVSAPAISSFIGPSDTGAALPAPPPPCMGCYRPPLPIFSQTNICVTITFTDSKESVTDETIFAMHKFKIECGEGEVRNAINVSAPAIITFPQITTNGPNNREINRTLSIMPCNTVEY